MKLFTKLGFFLLIVFAVQTTVAQNLSKLTYMAESRVSTGEAQIALRSEDENITQVRLISEKTGKLTSRALQFSEAVFIRVELEEGENKFTLLGYDKTGVLDASTIKSIIIKRVSAPTSENVGSTSLSSSTSAEIRASERSNFSSASSNPNRLAGRRLGLNGKRKIENNNTVALEINSSEMESQIGNYVIEVKDKDGKITFNENRKIVQDEKINRQKLLQTESADLTEGINTIKVYPEINGESLLNSSASIEVTCTSCKEKEIKFSSQKVIFRSIIGLEQSGASSAKSEQRPFLNFFFNTPLNFSRGENKPDTKHSNDPNAPKTQPDEENESSGFSVWGDIRLTTTPVQGIGSLAEFSPAGFATGFVQGDSAAKVNDLVRSFDFLIGVEQEIFKPKKLFSGSFPGRTSLSLIAAGGAITPLSSDKTAAFYKIPTVNNGTALDPRFTAAFPDIDFTGKTNVAFVTPDRDRFFRQYYAGFRLKTFFNEKEFENFPAMFDITFGQNEAITSRLKGVIMRLDGSTPFPVPGADFLYLFGSVNMKLGKTVNESLPSFFLDPATGVSLSGSDTAVISIDRAPFQTRNRDVFRIGVGINLFRLFKKDEPANK